MFNFKTRNFTIGEVVHRAADLPVTFTNCLLAGYAAGTIETTRAILNNALKKIIKIKIISGKRLGTYNKTLKKSTTNSFHDWGVGDEDKFNNVIKDKQLIFAIDFEPINADDSRLTAGEMWLCYLALKGILLGEFYYNIKDHKFHYSPARQLNGDEFWNE